jgi:F-box/WD-40 domain protein MET30
MWNLATGEEIQRWFGHVEGVWALDSNSFRLASGGRDHAVIVYDFQERRMMFKITFSGEGGVNCLQLTDTKMCVGTDSAEVIILDFGWQEQQ